VLSPQDGSAGVMEEIDYVLSAKQVVKLFNHQDIEECFLRNFRE
jgi:hypothetical protein